MDGKVDKDTSSVVIGVIVTYRRPDDLRENLSALTHQTVVPESIYVIDNWGDEEVRAICNSAPVRVIYDCPGENLGPAGGFRRGIDLALSAGFDGWLIMLNDEPPLYNDDIEGLLQLATAQPMQVAGVGLSGGAFDLRDGLMRRYRDVDLHGMMEVDYIAGLGNAMYRANALRVIGGHDPDLFFGYEELELGLRLQKAGFKLIVDGDRLYQRREDGSRLNVKSGVVRLANPLVAWRRYYSSRNLISILKAYGRWYSPIFSTSLMMASSVMRVVHRESGSFGYLRATLFGVLHGWVGIKGHVIDPMQAPQLWPRKNQATS